MVEQVKCSARTLEVQTGGVLPYSRWRHNSAVDECLAAQAGESEEARHDSTSLLYMLLAMEPHTLALTLG